METIHWKRLIKGEYSIKEIIDYFRAELRYFIYYKYYNLEWLMRDHIREQIDFRINTMMDKECYNNGQCKVCGCTTPDLQFTNSSCKGLCYPPLVDKDTWQKFKEKKESIIDNTYKIEWINKNKSNQLDKLLIIKHKL